MPEDDSEIAGWVRSLGLPGLIDLHVHFLPTRVMDKVWAYFDRAGEHYGVEWPITYRLPEAERLSLLRSFGVIGFAPLVYPHKPGMGAWLTSWAMEFGSSTPGAVPTATLYPEPGVAEYLGAAVAAGARCVKAHVQVGSYDPRDPLLEPAWGLLAEAGVPVVIHCGNGPVPGEFTGLKVFEQVLQRHPRLVAVLAHAGMPEFDEALRLAASYETVFLDTTMVGTPFAERMSPLPADWSARLADLGDRVALGTDFPNIPYDYATQLRAIESWGLGQDFLRRVLHDTPARLLGLAGMKKPPSV